jgi:soluble lytic murein transglycosylase
MRQLTILLSLSLLWGTSARAAAPKPSKQAALARLGAAAKAYRAHDYETCADGAEGLDHSGLLNPDAALFLQAQCAFYAGRWAPARALFSRLAKSHPDSPHATLAAWRTADCDWELGQHDQATKAYKRTDKRRTDPRVDAAVGLARRAIFEYDKSRPARAQRLWIELRRRFPIHPLSTPAAPDWPEPKLSFADSLSLGKALSDARAWERALEILDAAAEPRNERQRYKLAALSGRVLFDMRFHYDQAAQMLLATRERAPNRRLAEEAWFYASRALGRADRDDEAVASHLAMVKRYPKGQHADRALYYAGWLQQNQGRCDKAQALFRRVIREYPKSRWAREARWFSAWCHLGAKKWKRATEALRPQLEWRGFRFGGRARYWTAVALRELGQKEAADQAFLRVIADHPLTWYSRLSRLRLGDRAPALRPPPARAAQSADLPSLADPLLRRAAELVEADLKPFAIALLRKNEKRFLASHTGRAGRLALMKAFGAAGDFHRPWYLSLVRERTALESLPGADTHQIWAHAYPACERDRLTTHAKNAPMLVLLLQAIMRTESGFDPQALSVADARGLMQMIPPTAIRVAQALSLVDYSPDALFDPETNIRTATWYIGRLVTKFKGQWPVAAAAYNAGPEPMMKWCKSHAGMQIDAFVESIPFTESRRYAKRVFTAMSRYAWLEGAAQPNLELTFDPKYSPMEPNF